MSYPAWSHWLPLFFLLLVIIGLFRFVRGRTSRRVALLLMALGAVGLLATRVLTRGASPTSAKSAASAETQASARSFATSGPLGVAIDAPEGWLVHFDSAAGSLQVIHGAAPSADAVAVLQVMSTFSSDEVDADRMLRITTQKLREEGATIGQSFPQTINGLPALGATADDALEKRCIWFVRRGPKYVSALTCVSRDATSGKDACHEPIERLRWRVPAVK